MISFQYVCDECNVPVSEFSTYLTGTGRVLINGVDNNRQAVELCDDHKSTEDNPWQPNDCKKVSYFWPGGEK